MNLNGNNMWQICPLCIGTGLDPTVTTGTTTVTCPVCDSARIISEITGNPPKYDNVSSTINASITPIRRGCHIMDCGCDGSCNEIIGYKFE